MSNHSLKKRRAYVHEDAPVVPVPQHPPLPSASASATFDHPPSYSSHEIHILEEAAHILKCPVSQLVGLHQGPHLPQQHSPPSVVHPTPNKRPRLNTAIAPMSFLEKPSPSGQSTSEYNRLLEDRESGAPLGIDGSRLSHYLTNISICPPCMTCEPQGYGGISMTSYNYVQPPPYYDHKSPPNTIPGSIPPGQTGTLSGDDQIATTPMMPNYPALQPSRPMTVQPNTSGESMVYPESGNDPGYGRRSELHHAPSTSTSNHLMKPHAYSVSPIESPKEVTRQTSAAQNGLFQEVGKAQRPDQPRNLDIVQSNQRPPPARRGPFRNSGDREKTAETRRIGSCIRCRMQRIRCETNPQDKMGSCLTCERVSNVKVWRMPCLRYKITDVRLFKPGQVKGHEWTRRWVEGVADDISHWASSETRKVHVTEGYTSQPVELRVRRFVPQDGDALERSWVYQGKRKKVKIPAYAIVNLEEAKAAYSSYISDALLECCKTVLSGKERLLMATYIAALKATRDPATDQKERELLQKALKLWMAIRLTTKSTIIVGEETLGMSRDIMDETSPLQGCIPLPPVMGAQIELVLIHQIQSTLRRDMLESLQAMTQANKHQTWYTTYLITFILLHNVALLCQHDAAYSRKHGFKTRFAREDMVKEYQLGANILLAYFHYCNKGIYPFSAECKESDLKSLAELDDRKTHFIKLTREIIDKHKKQWTRTRENRDYENDFFFISQLYEENWQPQSTI